MNKFRAYISTDYPQIIIYIYISPDVLGSFSHTKIEDVVSNFKAC